MTSHINTLQAAITAINESSFAPDAFTELDDLLKFYAIITDPREPWQQTSFDLFKAIEAAGLPYITQKGNPGEAMVAYLGRCVRHLEKPAVHA